MKPRIPSTARLSFPLATALAALLTAQSASAADGTWLGTTGNWTDAGTWSGGTIADGTGFSANFTGADITFDETITLAADRTIGNITFTDATTSSNNLLITGANLLTLDVASGAPAINVTQSGRTLTIDSVIAGTDGLQKTGAGTLALNGSAVNTFTGGLTVNGGTLTIDYANLATPTNLVDSTDALQINNGALTITGNATTDTVQTFAGTSLGAGTNALNVAKGASATSATVNLGALTTTAGSVTTINPGTAWVNNVPSTTEKVFITSVNGNPLPVSGKVNVNASLFYRQSTNPGAARWVSMDSAGQLQGIPAASIGILSAATAADPISAYQISSANITLTNPAMAIYGLVLNGNSTPRTLTLADNGTLTLNGILGVQGTNQTNILPGTGTSNLIIGPEKNLVINLDNSAPLSVTAPIADSGGGASAVTIASTAPTATTPGTVTFGGANTYTGATTITRGTLSLTNATPFGTTPGTNGTSGISMAAGTTLQSNVAGVAIAAPITLSGAGNTTFLTGVTTGSTTSLNGAIGGATGNVVFTTATGSFSNASSTFVLGAAGTYTGNTLITTGNGANNPVTVRAGTGIVNALPATTVLSFGQSAGGGSGRSLTYDLNGNNQTLAGLNNALAVPEDRNFRVSSTNAATLTIHNTADFTFGGATKDADTGTNSGTTTSAQIAGAISLTKSGTGTFTLDGVLTNVATGVGNTFTGTTRILGGILVLGETLSIQNSTLNTQDSIVGDATNGLRTTVTALRIGGINGNKDFEDVFTTTSGGYDGLTLLTLNIAGSDVRSYSADLGDGAGGMNLTKIGTGTQILTAAQTSTGTTTGSAGVLLATQAAALPGYNVPGKVIFNGGTIAVQVGVGAWAALEVEALVTNATKTSGALGIDTTNGSLVQSTSFTAGTFGSTLGLNKLGSNDLTLDQANTFTGPTTVTAGTLTLTNANALQNSPLVTTGAGTVTLGSGTILNLGGLSGATGDLATVISNYSTVTAINLNTPATLPGAGLSYGGIISDGVPGTTLTKTGPGVQALSGANSYTGATQINDGVLVFRNKAAKTSGTATAAAAGSIGLGVKAADVAFYSEVDVADLFNTNSLPGFFLDPASGVVIDTTAASFDQTIALTAARSLTKNGGNTLTLSQVNTYSGSTSVTAGTLSLTGSLDGGGSISTVGTSVFSQTSTGIISGAATFTQGSTGTSSLAGTNTYTGVTNVNLGQLTISNADSLGTTAGNTVVAAGGKLALATASLAVAEPLTITGTGTTATNGAIGFGGGFTGMALTGPITLGGASRIQSDGSTGSTLSGGISLGANELTINTDGGATQTIDTTAITGTGGSLVKSGGGTLILGAANSYTGATTVNGGVLRITNAGALGTTAAGSVVNGSPTGSSANARIDLSGGVTVTGEAATLNGTGNFIGALTSSSGNNVWAGPVTIGSAGTRIGASAGASLEVSGVIDSGVDPHGLVIRTTDLTGVVVFSGANTYLGTTQILIGKLQLAAGHNRLPVGTALEFASSATNADAELDLNGTNQEVAGLALGGSAVASKNSVNNSSGTLSTLTVNTPAATSSTFAGILKGNLALVKAGADTLTLSGVNTYIGDTTVNAGTLTLSGADSAMDANTGNDLSTVTIAATPGATLDLAYTGTDEVNALFIGGVQKAPGVWGSSTSGAPNTDPQLTGTGTLTVATGPVSNNYASWAALQTPPVIEGPNGDDDKDGVKNLVEYALADGQERGSLTGTSLSFTKRGAPYGGDLTYEIETSDNLGISDPWSMVTPTVNNASTISYTLQNPGDNFARLNVTQVP